MFRFVFSQYSCFSGSESILFSYGISASVRKSQICKNILIFCFLYPAFHAHLQHKCKFIEVILSEFVNEKLFIDGYKVYITSGCAR